MSALEITFWVLLTLGLYPFAIYPVLVSLLGLIVRRPVRQDPDFRPTVTLIIAAYNEARHIEATVRNKLAQDYPKALMDLIVVSDGSTDGTDEIVARLAAEDDRIRFVRQEPRQGKTSALNLAVTRARGELLVFSDANSTYRPDTVRRLVRSFADPSVGYVTGKMLYANPDGSLVGDGCTAYMRYENRLWTAETRVGSIVGVDGAVDCVRRALYRPMRPDQLPDFLLSLDVIEQGYRVVFDDTAIVTEEALSTESAEQSMRVRVALRGLWAMWDKRALFNPLRTPLFSWQLASHKLLRYLSPLPLCLACTVNWLLLGRGMSYQLAAAVQAAFFLLVGARLVRFPSLANAEVVRYCCYFALLNWASARALLLFVRGEKKVTWNPRVG